MTLSDSPDARAYAVGVNGSLELWYEIAGRFAVFATWVCWRSPSAVCRT